MIPAHGITAVTPVLRCWVNRTELNLEAYDASVCACPYRGEHVHGGLARLQLALSCSNDTSAAQRTFLLHVHLVRGRFGARNSAREVRCPVYIQHIRSCRFLLSHPTYR